MKGATFLLRNVTTLIMENFNAKKKDVLQSKFQDCGKDSRKIHALMTNLITKQYERKLPPAKSDHDLA